jgi:hypothetical protein
MIGWLEISSPENQNPVLLCRVNFCLEQGLRCQYRACPSPILTKLPTLKRVRTVCLRPNNLQNKRWFGLMSGHMMSEACPKVHWKLAFFFVHEAAVPLAYCTQSNSNSNNYTPVKNRPNRDISLSPKCKDKQVHPRIITNILNLHQVAHLLIIV